MFNTIVTVVATIIQVFTVSWIIGLLEIASVTLICLSVFVRTKLQIPVVSKIEKTSAKIGNHFLMTLTNMPMIVMLRSKKREKEELENLNNSYLKSHIKRANICFFLLGRDINYRVFHDCYNVHCIFPNLKQP